MLQGRVVAVQLVREPHAYLALMTEAEAAHRVLKHSARLLATSDTWAPTRLRSSPLKRCVVNLTVGRPNWRPGALAVMA